MKTSFIGVFFLGAAIAACSSTGTPSTSGDGGEGGEQPVTSNNSSSSSSSGMGGAGGNGTGGAGGAGGGAPAVKADKLGQVCGAMMACPPNYVCILLDAMATNGFCTIPCSGTMDMTTCSMANGFPGPGAGQCALGAKDANGNVTNVCGIFCGAQFNLPDACPAGLTCQDKVNAMGMQGMDGKNDICAP